MQFWCIFWSDCVLKNSLKINIFLYKKNNYYIGIYTLNATGHLAPGEIFENMLQFKRFGLYFEGIPNGKWLLSSRNNDIGYTDMLGGSGTYALPTKILKWLMQSDAWCIIAIRLSSKKYHYLLFYRPISRVVIGREVDYRSRLIYVRYCLTNTTLCLWRSYDCTLACNYVW